MLHKGLTGKRFRGRSVGVLASRCAIIVWLAMALNGCIYLSGNTDQPASTALPAARDSVIARALDHDSQAAPRALLIQDPGQALTTRLHLIDAAETSIDLQYFIWQNDYSGILMIEKLLQAADRGVRIRALVDDVRLIGLIDRVSALNQHPNIEIRIYNPFNMRLRFPLAAFQLAEFALDSNRLNHRMHNKLLVADNQLAILGGRNIGDDYFGYSDDWYFIDTDILANGPIVTELSDGFDVYWNSRWSYPVNAISRYSVVSYRLETIRERIHKRLAARPELAERMEPTSFQQTLDRLMDGSRIDAYRILVDDPNLVWSGRPDTLATELAALSVEIDRDVIVATPYLVPTANLLDIGEELVARGVKIRVLTNSLATNNHVSAHAAYTRFRKRLLEMGVELYEFRPDARLAEDAGEATVTMHSKYILFDDDTVFVGSMNMDPRSLYLNTELGVILQSSDLVSVLRKSFDEMIKPENAYHLVNTAEGIEWRAGEEALDSEPATGFLRTLLFQFSKLLPLSGQL